MTPMRSYSGKPSKTSGGRIAARVVVTGGQFPAALAALRSLHRHGFDPIAVATTRASYARFSHAAGGVHRVPDVSESASRFVEAVGNLCAGHEPALLIPGTEPELVALVKWRHLLPPSVLGLPTAEAMARVSDKILLNELASEAGMDVPPTSIVENTDQIEDASLPFPGVAKPVRTVGRRGDALTSLSAVAVSSPLELRSFLAKLNDERAIVQPLLEGDLYSLAGVMWNGKLHAPVQQVALSIFPEPCGGSALARTVTVEEARVQQLERMLKHMGWEGIVQLQWIRTAQSDFVIDLNPRIYGSLALANAAGSDLAAIWAKLLLNIPVAGGAAPREVLYRNLETFARARRGPRFSSGYPPAAVVVSSVFVRSDPFPVLASIVRGLQKLLRDLRQAGERLEQAAPNGTRPCPRSPDQTVDDDVSTSAPGSV